MNTRSTNRPPGGANASREPLDPGLEQRVAALESSVADAGSDFDAASWFWMLMLGVVVPVALLLWGWFGR
jgi:hypothetical protein